MPYDKQYQNGRGGQIDDGQEVLDSSGSLAKNLRERIGTLGELTVQFIKSRREELNARLVRREIPLHFGLYRFSEYSSSSSIPSVASPLLYGDVQILDLPEMAKQPYHARDVVGMIFP